MPQEWLPKILDEAKALGIQEVIPSTMGEPLIYRHFEYLIDCCAERGLRLNITTNGSFLRFTPEEWAERIVPYTSDIKFSWNGATKETYEQVMIGLNFEKSLENLQRFIAVRNRVSCSGGSYCRVTLQLTFMTNNMHELPDIVRLAAACNVDRIKGHHLWAHWEAIEELSFKNSRENRQAWNHIVKQTQEAAAQYLRSNEQPVLLEGIYPLPETDEVAASNALPDSYSCPFLGKEIWVAPDGRINPCCAPDNLRQSLGYFGRVPETSLGEALESPAYYELLEGYKQLPLCQTCNMRKP